MKTLADRLAIVIAETLTVADRSGPAYKAWLTNFGNGPMFGPTIATGETDGMIPTSHKAMSELHAIALTFRENDAALDRTATPTATVSMVARAIAQLLVEHGESFGMSDVRARFATFTEDSRGDITHYIPAWVFHAAYDRRFDVGPVSFLPRQSWLDEVEARAGRPLEWASHLRTGTKPERLAGLDPNLYDLDLAVMMACVTVHDHEPSQSRQRALLAVRLALDAMRLALGPLDRKNMITLHDYVGPDRETTLAQVEGHPPAVGWSRQIRGLLATTTPEDVLEMTADLRAAAGRRIGVMLRTTVASSAPCTMLSERWLNAVHWFGKAVQDDGDFMAIVHAGIALDVLTGGKEKRGIRQLTGRLLDLEDDDQFFGDGTTLSEAVERIYQNRSRIAHGTTLAIDANLQKDRARAENLLSVVLHSYLFALDDHAVAGGKDDGDALLASINAPSA